MRPVLNILGMRPAPNILIVCEVLVLAPRHHPQALARIGADDRKLLEFGHLLDHLIGVDVELPEADVGREFAHAANVFDCACALCTPIREIKPRHCVPHGWAKLPVVGAVLTSGIDSSFGGTGYYVGAVEGRRLGIWGEEYQHNAADNEHGQ